MILDSVEVRPNRRVILTKEDSTYSIAVQERTADGWRTVRESDNIPRHHLAMIGYNSAVAYEKAASI